MTDLQETLSGVVVGYDPGGNDDHGLAELVVEAGHARSLSARTVSTTEQALAFFEGIHDVVALGIDTLTCWSTGPGGWRPADRWLRKRYRLVSSSVIVPNGLYGSMVISGMTFLLGARLKRPDIFVTETHPKVLLFHLTQTKYNYVERKEAMDRVLADALGIEVTPANEHQWDAALSAYAALEGATGRWKQDLHQLPTAQGERLVWPGGRTAYCWPD